MTVLYLVSKKSRLDYFQQHLQTNDVKNVYLCPIEYGCEPSLESLKAVLTSHKITFQLVDFIALFNENAFRFKDDFLALINKFSESKVNATDSLKKYFFIPGTRDSVWWMSLVYEMNPYKSQFYSHYVKSRTLVALIKEIKSDRIWSDCEDQLTMFLCKNLPHLEVIVFNKSKSRILMNGMEIWIVEQLRFIKFFAESLFKIFYLKISNRTLEKRWSALKGSKCLVQTMFPMIDHEKLAEGKFVNRAYGELQDVVEEEFNGRVTWMAMASRMEGQNWVDAVRIAKRVNNLGNNLIFYEEFLGFRGALKSFFVYWIISAKCLKFLFLNKDFFNDRVSGYDVEWWDIFKKDFLSSFSGKDLYVELSYYFSFDRAFSQLPSEAKVVYFAELQGWENALNMRIKHYPQLSSYGLQHTIVPLLLLCYFRDPKDFLRKGDGDYPLPTRLACTGEVTRTLFIQNGWPKEKVFVLGAFRFPSLLNVNSHSNKLNKKKIVVVALSISMRENEELLYLLKDAFKENSDGLEIWIKAHPIYPLEKHLEMLGLSLDSGVFKISKEPLSKIVPQSKVMIVKESSSAFEALARGIPIVIPQFYSMEDLCPLSKLSDVQRYVYNSYQLREVVGQLLQEEPSQKDINLRVECFKNYLKVLDKNGYKINLHAILEKS